jgi:hypothetical protein
MDSAFLPADVDADAIIQQLEKIILALYSHNLIGYYELTFPIYALIDQLLTPDQRKLLSQRVDQSLRVRRRGED